MPLEPDPVAESVGEMGTETGVGEERASGSVGRASRRVERDRVIGRFLSGVDERPDVTAQGAKRSGEVSCLQSERIEWEHSQMSLGDLAPFQGKRPSYIGRVSLEHSASAVTQSKISVSQAKKREARGITYSIKTSSSFANRRSPEAP